MPASLHTLLFRFPVLLTLLFSIFSSSSPLCSHSTLLVYLTSSFLYPFDEPHISLSIFSTLPVSPFSVFCYYLSLCTPTSRLCSLLFSVFSCSHLFSLSQCCPVISLTTSSPHSVFLFSVVSSLRSPILRVLQYFLHLLTVSYYHVLGTLLTSHSQCSLISLLIIPVLRFSMFSFLLSSPHPLFSRSQLFYSHSHTLCSPFLDVLLSALISTLRSFILSDLVLYTHSPICGLISSLPHVLLFSVFSCPLSTPIKDLSPIDSSQ